MKKKIKQHLWILSGTILGVVGCAWVAFGATYNFYFNNTEQGPNSTATPTVTVSSDGKVTGAANGAGALGGAPAPVPTPGVAIAAPQAAVVEGAPVSAAVESPASFRRWRISGGVFAVNSSSTFGETVGLEYRISKGVGVNLFGGVGQGRDYEFDSYGNYFPTAGTQMVFGAELELQVASLSIGRFENVFDLQLLGGANTFTKVRGNFASAHVGLRADVNLGDQWGITTAARGNLGFIEAEAGLLIHI